MSHIHFTLLDTASQSLKGYQILLRPDHDNTYHSVEVWSLPLGSSPSELKERNELEPEIKVMESENGPISTLGRILYDRSTLYSYLNPHLVVATILHKRNPPPVLLRGTPNKTTILATTRAEIHVLDSVSGNLTYSRTIDEVVEEEGIEAVLSRNWLVYKFSTREGEEGERQVTHRLITVELYEGDGVNRKTERCVKMVLSTLNLCAETRTVTLSLVAWKPRLMRRERRTYKLFGDPSFCLVGYRAWL